LAFQRRGATKSRSVPLDVEPAIHRIHSLIGFFSRYQRQLLTKESDRIRSVDLLRTAGGEVLAVTFEVLNSPT
jgi:hypothetical protein